MVSIITVNYNGANDTCEMIESFRKHETYTDYEIIVVDNGSSNPAEVPNIKARCPEAMVIQSTNTGFAGGNNTGIRQAHGDYIFCLNNDTIIKAPILEPLVARLQEGRTGAVSPMIRFSYPPYDIQYYGDNRMTPITLRKTTPPYDTAHQEQYSVAHPTEVLHGAAMMLRRDAIDQIGLMYEGFFLFYEELDWSYRLSEQGYDIWYEPKAVVYHKEGQTIGKITPTRRQFLSRSRIIFARRHLNGLNKMLSCSYLLSIVLTRDIINFVRKGRFDLALAAIKGSWSGICAQL